MFCKINEPLQQPQQENMTAAHCKFDVYLSAHRVHNRASELISPACDHLTEERMEQKEKKKHMKKKGEGSAEVARITFQRWKHLS